VFEGFPQFPDGIGLTHLPGSPYQQNLSIRVVLPIKKFFIDASFHVRTSNTTQGFSLFFILRGNFSLNIEKTQGIFSTKSEKIQGIFDTKDEKRKGNEMGTGSCAYILGF
jgi:hypothetical protein